MTTKVKRNNSYSRVVYATLCVALVATVSCNASKEPKEKAKAHAIEIRRPNDSGSLYLDPVPNELLLQRTQQGATKFYSFLIGFKENAPTDSKQKLAWEKYVQFDLAADLSALVQGNSLKAVFYQPKPQVFQGVDEGYVVFEVPQRANLDTLVYRDSFGGWGTQYLIVQN